MESPHPATLLSQVPGCGKESVGADGLEEGPFQLAQDSELYKQEWPRQRSRKEPQSTQILTDELFIEF